MQTRIYVVTAGETKRLVEASSAAQAIRHCAKGQFAAAVASTKDVAEIVGSGKPVEKASEQ